jgi:hypothetical protein
MPLFGSAWFMEKVEIVGSNEAGLKLFRAKPMM